MLLTSAIVCFIEITMSNVNVKIYVMLCLGAIVLLITNNYIEADGNNVAWLYLNRVVNALWTFPSWRVGWSKNATILLATLVSVSFIRVAPSIVV